MLEGESVAMSDAGSSLLISCWSGTMEGEGMAYDINLSTVAL